MLWTGDFVGSVVLGAIFGALGGMLGILIFRRATQTPPAAAPGAGFDAGL